MCFDQACVPLLCHESWPMTLTESQSVSHQSLSRCVTRPRPQAAAVARAKQAGECRTGAYPLLALEVDVVARCDFSTSVVKQCADVTEGGPIGWLVTQAGVHCQRIRQRHVCRQVWEGGMPTSACCWGSPRREEASRCRNGGCCWQGVCPVTAHVTQPSCRGARREAHNSDILVAAGLPVPRPQRHASRASGDRRQAQGSCMCQGVERPSGRQPCPTQSNAARQEGARRYRGRGGHDELPQEDAEGEDIGHLVQPVSLCHLRRRVRPLPPGVCSCM